jgi:hypothetical protein
VPPAQAAPPKKLPPVAPPTTVAHDELTPPPNPNDPRAPVLPYYEGMPVPPGYTIVHKPATGLITGGLVGFGVSYGGALIVAAAQGFDNASGWLVLPIAGPWLAIAQRDYEQCKTATVAQARRCVSHAVKEVQYITFAAVDGVFQIASSMLVLAGAISARDELIRQDLVHVNVSPNKSGGADWAVTLHGQF